jgi:hypothetical protein
MIQDRDRQLREQHFGSLIPSRDRMWFHLGNTRAEISTVTLLPNRITAARKSETSPMAAQRTLARCQTHPIIQPVADSLSGKTVERLQNFDIPRDQVHTCQKEQ